MPDNPSSSQALPANVLHGFQQEISGHDVILSASEHSAYLRLSSTLVSELNPQTESERQIVQKIADCHARLNRLSVLAFNLGSLALLDPLPECGHDPRTASLILQTLSWQRHSGAVDRLGRCEARLSRQLLRYTREFERLESARLSRPTAGPDKVMAAGSVPWSSLPHSSLP